MIIDATAAATGQWDVIVVGAGAVGLTMATALTRSGRRVLLVEGGPEVTVKDFARANSAVSQGRRHNGLTDGRYKGLGGTTRLWGGQLMHLTSADLLPCAKLGKPGWPIGSEELCLWQDRALTHLGVKATWDEIDRQWSAKAGVPVGIDDELRMEIAVWLSQPDFTRLFRNTIADLAGPAILVDALVSSLHADAASGAIDGVRVTIGGKEVILLAPRCVLAAGTIETAALLLRTQRLLPRSSVASNPNVGAWFLDHLHGQVGTIALSRGREMGRMFDTVNGPAGKFSSKFSLADKIIAEEGLARCALAINPAFTAREILSDLGNLVRRVGSGASRETLRRTALLAPLVWRYIATRRSAKFLTGDANLGIEIEQLPDANSRIFLETGVPVHEARVGLRWNLGGNEMAGVARVAQALARYCHANGLAEITLDPRIIALDPAFLQDCYDASHQIGGARMARTANDGVVDSDGAVFGMPGLYVAGAATFPSASFVNPTLPAIALGLRLADRLARC